MLSTQRAKKNLSRSLYPVQDCACMCVNVYMTESKRRQRTEGKKTNEDEEKRTNKRDPRHAKELKIVQCHCVCHQNSGRNRNTHVEIELICRCAAVYLVYKKHGVYWYWVRRS